MSTYIIIQNYEILCDGEIVGNEYRGLTTVEIATYANIINNINKKYIIYSCTDLNLIDIFISLFGKISYTTKFPEKNLLHILLYEFQKTIIPKICDKLKSYEDLSPQMDLLKIYSSNASYLETGYIEALSHYLSIADQIDKLPKILHRDLDNIIKDYIFFDQIGTYIIIPDPKSPEDTIYGISIHRIGCTNEKKTSVKNVLKKVKNSKYLNYVMKFVEKNNLLSDSIVRNYHHSYFYR